MIRTPLDRPSLRILMLLLFAAALAAPRGALALQAPEAPGRFTALEIPDPSGAAHPSPVAVPSALAAESASHTWDRFRATHGEGWDVRIDARSGAPLLAQGEGIPWIAGSGNALAAQGPVSIDSLAASLKAFIAQNRELFVADVKELELDREASGDLTPDLWQIVFTRRVGGITVTGDRYIFYVGHGNLIAFGATRWSTVEGDATPALGLGQARARLLTYLGLTGQEAIETVEPGSLAFTPVTAPGTEQEYSGPMGGGYGARLTWRFALRLEGEHETWVGLVDARTGEIVAFYDDNMYAQVKGGVYPVSNDGSCPSGCEQPGFPMPFVNVSINGGPATTANTLGNFTCSPVGGNAVTTLTGPYVRVIDTCGAISQAVTCNADLNLGTSSGTDCAVPAGASAGNTHASRTGFYHINRIKEHVRTWLPANPWLSAQLTNNVNINLTCNAFWNGATLNFYRSSSSCRNSGEIQGVFLHEWGHGLDSNDGGGVDNPSEAYADVTAILHTHTSCLGRGFRKLSPCTGYGNACLTCTGVRELDWDQRANHTPSTPEGFIATCPGGGGPCGKEIHCEGYLAAETIWDLAVRDLPASGIDLNTSWQIVDRLWYKSRQGSGGAAYGCGGTIANRSCGATSWFTKLRTIDDDDGNLANGTPHAAAIFAAFNRHNIPCGLSTDAANQSTSSCPVLAAPTLTVTPGSGSIGLSWTAVPGAASYVVLRNDLGCSSGFTIVATVAGISYNDTGLVNGYPEYYSVQAIGSNSSCLGALAPCVSATPTPTVTDLAVTKTDSPDPVLVGQTLAYTITVTNNGPVTAPSVVLDDVVPANTTFLSIVEPGGWSCSTPPVGGTGPISCSIASLGVGSPQVFTLNVKVNFCVPGGSSIPNTASVSSGIGDSVPGNNSALASTLVANAGCNDGNLCTDDTCHPATGCAHANNTLPCDDANACTTADACAGGSCAGGPPTDCDDVNPCTDDACVPATGCAHANNTGPCDDLNPCTTGDVCAAGSCQPGAQNTDPCEDGNLCTSGDICAAGTCISGPPTDCDDENLCTDDSCVPNTGCANVNNTAPCDDANPCTTGDTCAIGTCWPGAPNTDPCDDGSACTTGDACAGGTCVPGPPTNCDDANPCTDDSCAPATGCAHENNTAACSDGNPCTSGDVCAGGSCQPGPPNTDPCDDGNACTSGDACAGGTCQTGAPNTDPCDDGNPCTTGDACSGGSCAGGPPTDCDDANPCTDDSCAPATGCAHANNTASCDDANACTTGDTCGGGSCQPGAPNTDPCDDANACTTGDACSGGTCLGGPPPDCSDGNACTDDSCVPATGCAHANNTAPCDDANACTTGDACAGGSCVGGAPPNCDDANPCTDDSCAPATGCAHDNNTALCDDANPCTSGDICGGGSCQPGAPNSDPCDDGNACTTGDACGGGSCQAGAPNTDPCDDGNACTTGDACAGGSCAGGPPPNCDDADPCTDDACVPATGCAHANNTAPCDDGNPCTTGDACAAGACGGAPVPPPGEVNNSLALTHSGGITTIAWSDGPGPFNVYRGSETSSASWSYNHACLASMTAGPETDALTPLAGELAYYLVARRDACGESIPGRNSLGAPIPNPTPCP